SVDVFPTLLDLAGIASPNAGPARPGHSVAPALRGESIIADETPAFAESLTPRIHYGWSDLEAIRDGRWKYILAPRPELYDLAADPGELTNLADAAPARARALRSALDRHLAETHSTTPFDALSTKFPADTVEKLGALGYVSGGGTPDSADAGADPKDKIGEYRILNRLLREGLVALREEDYTESVQRFRALASRGIDS